MSLTIAQLQASKTSIERQSDLLMQTETRNSWGACLKYSKTKSKSFTRGRQAPNDPRL